MVIMVLYLMMICMSTCILIMWNVKLDHMISVMDRYRHEVKLCFHGNYDAVVNAINMVDNIS